jgi:hypothetical protein
MSAPVKGAVLTLGKRTPGVRMVAGAEQVRDLACAPYLSKQTVANPAGNYTVRVDYLAKIV